MTEIYDFKDCPPPTQKNCNKVVKNCKTRTQAFAWVEQPFDTHFTGPVNILFILKFLPSRRDFDVDFTTLAWLAVYRYDIQSLKHPLLDDR